MLKKDVVVGKVYIAKVAGRLTRVRIDSQSSYGGWLGTNLRSGREVRIRSAQRLRFEAAPPEVAECPHCGSPDRRLHPALSGGGEVQACTHSWHSEPAR